MGGYKSGGGITSVDYSVVNANGRKIIWELLDDQTVSNVTTITSAAINSATHSMIRVVWNLTSSTNGSYNLRLNNDSTASDYKSLNFTGTTAAAASNSEMFCGQQGSGNLVGEYLINTAGSGGMNHIRGSSGGRQSATAGYFVYGGWKLTGVNVTSVNIFSDQANSLSGRFWVYGLRTG